MTINDERKSRTLTINRTFDAPVELVWEAWTQPEHIAAWWVPKGLPIKIHEHVFREGGKWKYTVDMPDGMLFISEGEYRVIISLKEIYSTANFIPMTEGVEIQVLLESAGDKTDFTFNCIHPTEAYCKQQEKMGFFNGWGTGFERLNVYLIDQLNK